MDQKALTEAYKAAERALLEAQRTDLLYGLREGAPPIAPWPTEPCKIMHRQRLVRVDSKTGLGMKDAQQAIEILALPWWRKS